MWYRLIGIIDWFGELSQRMRVLRDFNASAKEAFIAGAAPTLLQAKVTSGDARYRHDFSKWLGGGFRIKALSGEPMSKPELVEIARVVLDNEPLVRKLISLGWDTLEVHAHGGILGVKFPLKQYANIGGYLNS
jgi:hypothetical protein